MWPYKLFHTHANRPRSTYDPSSRQTPCLHVHAEWHWALAPVERLHCFPAQDLESWYQILPHSKEALFHRRDRQEIAAFYTLHHGPRRCGKVDDEWRRSVWVLDYANILEGKLQVVRCCGNLQCLVSRFQPFFNSHIARGVDVEANLTDEVIIFTTTDPQSFFPPWIP